MNIQNIIKNFQTLVAIGLWAVLLFCFTTSPLYSQNKEDLEQLIRESKTRAALVQNVQKAVVHIKVEKILRDSQGNPLTTHTIYTTKNFSNVFFLESSLQKGNPVLPSGRYGIRNHHQSRLHPDQPSCGRRSRSNTGQTL